eukprot:COSAG02_NODE_8391_length_2587_cov_2.391479_2_plen_165_part_00
MSPPGAVDELGRLPSLVYNLRSRSWGSLDAELRQGTVWKLPPLITQHALDLVVIKGLGGSHEREAWVTCPQLLLSPHAWQITRSVEFSAIEHMVVVLVVRQRCMPSAFAQSHHCITPRARKLLTVVCGAALSEPLHRHGENAVPMVCGGQHSCDSHAPQRRGRV